MRIEWLDRHVVLSPYLTLCVTEASFEAVCRHCNIPKPYPSWVSDGAEATTHIFQSKFGEVVCIVCCSTQGKKDPSLVYGLLAHEATHVWTECLSSYPGVSDDEELRCVGVQLITTRLIKAWNDSVRKKRNGKERKEVNAMICKKCKQVKRGRPHPTGLCKDCRGTAVKKVAKKKKAKKL